ncbi:hypothetical protein [Dolichospermum phage Dfl-JY23]
MDWLKTHFVTNWKTTLFGFISALAGFIAFNPENFPQPVVMVAQYINTGGAAVLGIYAYDSKRKAFQAER